MLAPADEDASLIAVFDIDDFYASDRWQKKVRNAILVPQYYKGKQFVLLDKGDIAKLLQTQYGIDTFVQSKGGRVYGIDEKIVQWPKDRTKAYDAYALETRSCTKPGREKDSSMRYGMADFLLYCFQLQNLDLDCHLIDFQKLKEWFWPVHETFPKFGPLKTRNATEGRVVPISVVDANVRTWSFRLLSPSRFRKKCSETNSQLDMLLEAGLS